MFLIFVKGTIYGIFLIFQNKSPLEAKPKPTKRDTARYIPVFHSGPRQKNYRAPGRRQLSAQLFDKIIIMYCIILILLYIFAVQTSFAADRIAVSTNRNTGTDPVHPSAEQPRTDKLFPTTWQA